jgi:hypothetical protein
VALRRHLSVTLPFCILEQALYKNPGLTLSTPYSLQAHPAVRPPDESSNAKLELQ